MFLHKLPRPEPRVVNYLNYIGYVCIRPRMSLAPGHTLCSSWRLPVFVSSNQTHHTHHEACFWSCISRMGIKHLHRPISSPTPARLVN